MSNNYLDINKTKYRYLMDNLDLSEERPLIFYTIPVPRGPESKDDEFFNRDYPDICVSNITFNEMIDKTAKALLALGVKKGDVITVCHTNTPEILYMDYALNKIGGVANYIYPNVTAEEMRSNIEEVDSRWMYILDEEPIRVNVKAACEGKNIPVISSSVIESFPEEFRIIAESKMPKSVTELPNEIKWRDFIDKGASQKSAPEVPYVPNAICSYVHTSGTSSRAKAVIESNENINSIPRNYYIDKEEYKCGKLCLQTIPHFVEYGKVTNHLIFCNNTCLLFIPEMDPKNFYDLVHKYKPEYSFATPSHFRELIKRPTDMSSCITYLVGGDSFVELEEAVEKYLRENGCKAHAYQGYGATEMSAATIKNSALHYKKGSLGVVSGEVKAIIVEPGTFNEITEPNVVGEICVTGTSTTLGYAGENKEEMDKIFVKHPDGKTYVHMGDFVSRDEDGFFFYHGRIKNVITRKSFKFSPNEIVDAIMLHPEVSGCVVVPKYSKDEGETPSAHITLHDGADAKKVLPEILKIVENSVQEFHRPTDYKIRKSMPRTRNNKNDFIALKIEDNATVHPLVKEAEIELLTTGEFDYRLTMKTEKPLTDAEKDEVLKYYKSILGIVKLDRQLIDCRFE